MSSLEIVHARVFGGAQLDRPTDVQELEEGLAISEQAPRIRAGRLGVLRRDARLLEAEVEVGVTQHHVHELLLAGLALVRKGDRDRSRGGVEEVVQLRRWLVLGVQPEDAPAVRYVTAVVGLLLTAVRVHALHPLPLRWRHRLVRCSRSSDVVVSQLEVAVSCKAAVGALGLARQGRHDLTPVHRIWILVRQDEVAKVATHRDALAVIPLQPLTARCLTVWAATLL